MDLPQSQVWDVLAEAGVDKLYHANSVITSCQFLRSRALLARGSVERSKLAQSDQYSDGDDKRYSLWFDVFVDGVDIHNRASRENQYGPVLFVLNLEKLRKLSTGRIWVTKLNPTKWNGKNRDQRWFQSKQDLEENFVYGNFDHMVVFRHIGGSLPIDGCLEEIILDDVKMKLEGFDLASTAYGALTLAMCDGDLNIPISKRECKAACQCKARYKAKKQRTIEMFYPYA